MRMLFPARIQKTDMIDSIDYLLIQNAGFEFSEKTDFPDFFQFLDLVPSPRSPNKKEVS